MERPEARRRSLFLTGVGALVVWLAYLAREAVVPLLVALILAYILAPVVAGLQRRGFSRVGAVSTLFVVFFGAVGLAAAFGLPPLFLQGRVLVRRTLGEPARTLTDLPPLLAEIPSTTPGITLEALQVERARLLREGADGARPRPDAREGNYERQARLVNESGDRVAAEAFLERHRAWTVSAFEDRVIVFEDRDGNGRLEAGYLFQGALAGARLLRERFRSAEAAAAVEDLGIDGLPRLAGTLLVSPGSVAKGALGVLGSVLQALGWLVIVPLYTFYFLMRLEDVWTAFHRYLPGSHRERVLRTLGKIHAMLMGFFRGRLLTMLLKGIMVAVMLFAVGAPYAPVFGAAAGLLTIIPAAGPLLAAIPAVMLAWAEDGPTTAFLAMGVLLVAEVVEGYVLIPHLVGREVGLHPLAVVGAILVGAALLGLLGVVLAIPLAAAAKIVWSEFVLPDLTAKAAEGGGAPPAPP